MLLCANNDRTHKKHTKQQFPIKHVLLLYGISLTRCMHTRKKAAGPIILQVATRCTSHSILVEHVTSFHTTYKVHKPYTNHVGLRTQTNAKRTLLASKEGFDIAGMRSAEYVLCVCGCFKALCLMIAISTYGAHICNESVWLVIKQERAVIYHLSLIRTLYD